jgi:hypothetical protein
LIQGSDGLVTPAQRLRETREHIAQRLGVAPDQRVKVAAAAVQVIARDRDILRTEISTNISGTPAFASIGWYSEAGRSWYGATLPAQSDTASASSFMVKA